MGRISGCFQLVCLHSPDWTEFDAYALFTVWFDLYLHYT